MAKILLHRIYNGTIVLLQQGSKFLDRLLSDSNKSNLGHPDESIGLKCKHTQALKYAGIVHCLFTRVEIHFVSSGSPFFTAKKVFHVFHL